MLVLGWLFAVVTLVVGVVLMAAHGGSLQELVAVVITAGSFVVAGALAPRGRY